MAFEERLKEVRNAGEKASQAEGNAVEKGQKLRACYKAFTLNCMERHWWLEQSGSQIGRSLQYYREDLRGAQSRVVTVKV